MNLHLLAHLAKLITLMSSEQMTATWFDTGLLVYYSALTIPFIKKPNELRIVYTCNILLINNDALRSTNCLLLKSSKVSR